MGFYVEKTDSPNKSGIAQEDIKAGTIVALRSDGVYLANAGDGDEGFEGVADTPRRGDYIADEVDDSSDFTYKATDSEALSGAHRVPVAGYADGDIDRARMINDNSTDPAASISHNDIVGYVDASAVSGTAAEFEGRLVQEGYTDNGATTFNRTNGNFVAVGRAYLPQEEGAAVNDFDEVVRFIVDKSL